VRLRGRPEGFTLVEILLTLAIFSGIMVLLLSAFTGADRDREGLFEAAQGGTLFLDEIGHMPMSCQVKLLRAVEHRQITPIGSTTPVEIDLRLIAATNKDLTREVELGNFREDLFYRLNVVNIKIPPLRDRRGDIPLFIDYFINHFNIIQEKKVTGVSPEALEVLLNHDYPGNIRELRNIMEYVFIFCSEGEVREKHLPEYLKTTAPRRAGDAPGTEPSIEGPGTVPGERERLLEALAGTRWNKTKTAEILGVDRTTLWRKMKKHGIT